MSYEAPPVIENHPALGAKIRFEFQPYSRGTAIVEQVSGHGNGRITIQIRVIEGSETSRLFQYTATKSIAGQLKTAYASSEIGLMRAIENDSTFVYVHAL